MASEVRNSVVPWCTLTMGRSSARVGPRFTTTTGTPRLAACRTKRKPGHHRQRRAEHQQRVTVGVEGVHRGVAALDARLRDVLAEEHHVRLQHAAAGLAAGHHEAGGVGELDVAVGADRDVGVPVAPAGVELAEPLGAATRGWSARRQPRQTTSAIRPCRAHTAREPAASCRPSTFWVISSRSRPAASSAASARCPSLGVGALHPRPAEVRAGPVALLRVGPGDELARTSSASAPASPGPR